MASGVEERISRLEELMRAILEKLERIEAMMGSADTVIRLVVGYSLPVMEALEAARRLSRARRAVADEISMAILEAVADCKGYSISEITRRVRRMRGHASRRIVSTRIKELEKQGLLINTGTAARPRYILSACGSRPPAAENTTQDHGASMQHGEP